MSDISIQRVENQEQAAAKIKPQLLPSPDFGKWLHDMGGSLVFTTYQNSRVFFVSADESGNTHALDRIVGSAMGLAVDRDKMWIANKEQVWRFANVGAKTLTLEKEQPAVDYDAVYMPRWGILLGGCDTHDLLANTRYKGQNHELLFVNTNFSCVASIDGHYNFVPIWKPSFISAMSPEDRCHLNGMCAKDGQLAYATACAQTDSALAWKEQKNGGGVLIDISQDKVITEGLSMPHSPRWHNGKIWLLNSGDGQFGYVTPETGIFTPIIDCMGFARGLSIVGNFAIIGLSKLRENTFSSGLNIKAKLEKQHQHAMCGLMVVDLSTAKLVHWLTIEGITELYDVAFLAGIQRPFTAGFSHPLLHRHLFNVAPTFPIVSPSRPKSETTETIHTN